MSIMNKKALSLYLKKFLRRLAILSLVYLVFMLSVWLTLGRFFNTDTTEGWVLWMIIVGSIIAFIALIIYVEYEQWKARRIQ
jgi:uncharacterized membrane protein